MDDKRGLLGYGLLMAAVAFVIINWDTVSSWLLAVIRWFQQL